MDPRDVRRAVRQPRAPDGGPQARTGATAYEANEGHEVVRAASLAGLPRAMSTHSATKEKTR